VQVSFNYAAGKPMPVPAELRQALEADLKRCGGSPAAPR